MGGGGAMRTAAKVAGIGVSSGGLRGTGFTAMPPSLEPSMMRSVSRPVSSSFVSVSQSKVDDLPAARSPVWELDDWEFTGVEEDPPAVGSVGGDSLPRVVFSGPPTIEEAKEATRELKDAIDMFSKPYASDGGHQSSVSLFPDADSSESKTCITSSPGPMASPVPRVAMQAFSFLSESAAAQTVVASVAADPNVWYAVMQNEALMEFLESNKKSGAMLEDAESLNSDTKPSEENSSENSSKPGISLAGFAQDVKLKVVQIINGASSLLHDLFGSTSNDQTKNAAAADDDDGKARSFFINDTRTFLALAVMVIVVVILKRV